MHQIATGCDTSTGARGADGSALTPSGPLHPARRACPRGAGPFRGAAVPGGRGAGLPRRGCGRRRGDRGRLSCSWRGACWTWRRSTVTPWASSVALRSPRLWLRSAVASSLDVWKAAVMTPSRICTETSRSPSSGGSSRRCIAPPLGSSSPWIPVTIFAWFTSAKRVSGGGSGAGGGATAAVRSLPADVAGAASAGWASDGSAGSSLTRRGGFAASVSAASGKAASESRLIESPVAAAGTAPGGPAGDEAFVGSA